MNNRIISIMIDSASRPDLLKQAIETVTKHFKFDGELHWMYHEASLDDGLSEQCFKYVKSLKMFSEMVFTKEPKGEGLSIMTMLKRTKGKYFIHWEDDFIALRDIDLSTYYDILEENDDVNQVVFNRRATMHTCANFTKKEVERSGHVLTTSPHWRYTPAMWKLSFIKPKFKVHPGNNSHWEINKILQKEIMQTNGKLAKSADWVIEKLGTYYYGPLGEPAFCEHIGTLRSGRNPSS